MTAKAWPTCGAGVSQGQERPAGPPGIAARPADDQLHSWPTWYCVSTVRLEKLERGQGDFDLK
jgi:hypothetical protein